MMPASMPFDAQEICVRDIMVISGVRFAGKTVDMRKSGRLRHGLLLIQTGAVQFSPLDGHEVVAGAGDVVLIPKGLHYTMRYTAPETAFVLVNFALFTPTTPDINLTEQIILPAHADRDGQIEAAFLQLAQDSQEESASVAFARKACVFRLLALLFAQGLPLPSTVSRPKFANIIPGVTLLQQRYTEDIPIPQFAAACNISVSSFRALFTAQYGCSPVQYRIQLRIKRAKYLLGTGNCTVAEAADAVGFSNLGYFCRCYKRLTGETPRQSVARDS